jgi:Tol biopolymer transport system component
VVLFAALSGTAALANTYTLELCSVDSAEVPANSVSAGPDINSDGRYVVFDSFASNLASNDTNGYSDVFLRDRLLGTTRLVSLSTGGAQGNDLSVGARISGNGRIVAFYSEATNLVAGDTNASGDLFLTDVTTGTTQRVSVGPFNRQANGGSGSGFLSETGQYVAFNSRATNLILVDGNGAADVYYRDRNSSAPVLVSRTPNGNPGNGESSVAGMSPNGRYVLFTSRATNLVSGDTNGQVDMFLRDMTTGTTSRVNVSGIATQANAEMPFRTQAGITDDGRYVVFETWARLSSKDTDNELNVYLRDRNAYTSRVIQGPGGISSFSPCITPYFSSSSGAITFRALSPTGVAQVYQTSQETGLTSLVSHAPDGRYANGHSEQLAASAKANVVVFQSYANNLVAGGNGNWDIIAAEIGE